MLNVNHSNTYRLCILRLIVFKTSSKCVCVCSFTVFLLRNIQIDIHI